MADTPTCLTCAGVDFPTAENTPDQFRELMGRVVVTLDGQDITENCAAIPESVAADHLRNGRRVDRRGAWAMIWTRVDGRRVACGCGRNAAATISTGRLTVRARADR